MTGIIALIDSDSFYANAERVFRPDWSNRPLVVLSNNDGCVVARSPEAEALGVPMGAPYFQWKRFADANGIIVRSANYALYGDISRRVMQTLTQWSESVDVYSIDEAFLDLGARFRDAEGRFRGADQDAPKRPGDKRPALGDVPPQTRGELEALAQEIAATVKRWTGVPVSLGIAPTRTLAKAASRLAKDDFYRTGKKYALLFNREERVAGLKRLPVEKVWGVGGRLAATLRKSGVRTAFDLAKLDPAYMRESFSIVQERLVRELRGEECFTQTTSPTPQRSLQISRSFGETLETLEELEQPTATFASRAASKLRARGLCASGLQVYVATNRFNERAPQHADAAAVNFPKPTNSTPEILETALRLLRKLYKPGYAYKRAGVIALETEPETAANARRWLFEPDPTRPQERRDRDARLCEAVDRINARFGADALFWGAEGVKRGWSPNAAFLSPCYTTDWESLPCAR